MTATDANQPPYRWRQGLAVALVGVGLALLFFGPTDNWRWDPSFYYAQMRAPLIEGHLDFRPETVPPNGVSKRTVTGLQPSAWPIGPSILWSPFLLLAHIVVTASGNHQAATGFTAPYIAAVSAGSALYGLLGVLVTYRLCRLFGARGPALTATTLTLLATPLFFYVFRQPIMAHSASFLAAALLLLTLALLQRGDIPFAYSGLLLGTLVGLNMILRWVGLTLALLPALFFLYALVVAVRQRDNRRLRMIGGQIAIAAVIALIVVAPQMALWRRLYNVWFTVPLGGFSDSWLPVNFWNLFFHTNRGLLYWAPFVLLGMIGLARLEPRGMRLAVVVYLLAYCVLLGRWEIWTGGGGYGPRFFIETLPIVAVGFVCLIGGLWRFRWGRDAVLALAAVLIAHQFVLVTIVERAWLPLEVYFNGGPLGVGFQVDGLRRLLEHPAEWLQPRPFVGLDRQSLVASLLSGEMDWRNYVIPLIGAPLIGLGLGLAAAHARRRHLPLAAALLCVYMFGWFWFLLFV